MAGSYPSHHLGGIFSLLYTQYGNLPLLQLISVTGIYGVSFLMAWFASVGNWVWEQHLVWPTIRTITLLYSGLLALVFLGGSIRLTFFEPAVPTVRVVGVGVPLSMLQHAQQKFSQAAETDNPALLRSVAAPINNKLLDLTRIQAQAGAKIVVWREGGADVLATDEANLIQRSQRLARQQGIYIDMGVSVVQPPATFYDQSILVDPQRHVDWIYNKTHPAPGPCGSPGAGIVPVANTPYGTLATVICFDADFPGLGRQAANKGADILLVPANDWQGIDPWHAQHASFRAIEDGYSLVRQNGDGLELAVDYEGHVLTATDPSMTGAQQMMIAYVPEQGVWTIYAHIGDAFAWLCLAGSFLLLGLAAFLSFQKRSAASVPFSESASPASVTGVDGNETKTSATV